LPRSMSTTMAG